MPEEKRKIAVIDQTIREGMQHRGMMFGLAERIKILQFQNLLKVDISQVAYPSAHASEQALLSQITKQCAQKSFSVEPAGLGRALRADVQIMADARVRQFHMHTGVTQALLERFGEDRLRKQVADAVETIRNTITDPVFHVTIVDVGKTDPKPLTSFASFLMNTLEVDMLSLPDTSGIMSPMGYHDAISRICNTQGNRKTKISVHCHNDLGMGNANTVMGVLAGASVIEVSALGIGERNGIGDLYAVVRTLQQEGYALNLDMDNVAGFKAYYEYINGLYQEQIGEPALTFNTPFFGGSAVTHVAGTHGIQAFGTGITDEERYFFNVLTGRHILKKFAIQNGIDMDDNKAATAVKTIKDASVQKGRPLAGDEVMAILNDG